LKRFSFETEQLARNPKLPGVNGLSSDSKTHFSPDFYGVKKCEYEPKFGLWGDLKIWCNSSI